MLSNLLIEKTKPQAKTQRLSDGRGMYLEIAPTGGKWWRFKYRFGGRDRRISLGVYPDVGLADARDEVDRHRAIVKEHGSARQYRTADHAEKRAALAEKLATDSRAAFTVEKMVTAYLEEASDILKGWREVDRALKKYVVSRRRAR